MIYWCNLKIKKAFEIKMIKGGKSMKEKLKKFLAIMGVFGIIFSMSLVTNAVDKKQISLPANMKWTAKYSTSRNTSYSYSRARCHSVYPESGSDNFSRMRCRVVNSSGTVISASSYTILTEGASGNTRISLREGYLNLSTVYFQFCGNTKASAQAVVSYYG